MTAVEAGPFLAEGALTTATSPPLPGKEVEAVQLERLRRQLGYCYERSEFYQRRFDALGVHPDDIRSLEDFRQLPLVVTKVDERESEAESLERYGHPFGMHLCADPVEVVGISASTGTTGRPTFTYLFTASDLRKLDLIWARAMAWIGAPKGSLVLSGLGLSMWVVGTLAIRSLIEIGMRPIPVGAEGGVPRMLQMAELLSPEVLLCTPSLAERLVEQAPELLGKPVEQLGIRKLVCCGEPGAGLPEVRRRLEEAFGARVYDAQLGAHRTQLSCDSDGCHGMHHLTEDLALLELVDASTGVSVKMEDGATGRLLQTSLAHQARPSLKFDTGDIFEVFTAPCPGCGRGYRRLRILGRADDMLIVRGVNLYPSAVKDVVAEFVPRTTGEVRIVLSEPPPRVSPPLRLKVERGAEVGADEVQKLIVELEHRIFDVLRCRAAVEVVEPFSLLRSTSKSALVERAF